jgi:hypothetical protein
MSALTSIELEYLSVVDNVHDVEYFLRARGYDAVTTEHVIAWWLLN